MSPPAKRLANQIQSVYVRLTVRDAVAAIDWYQKVFGAEVHYRTDMPDGRVFHSLLSIGPAWFIVTDEFPETNTIAPTTVGVPISGLHLYVDDVDALAARAFEAGAEPAQRTEEDHFQITPEEDPAALADPSKPHPTFWGARFVMIVDPFGWRWELATPRETVTIGTVSDAIPVARQIEDDVRKREQGFFLRGRKKLTPEAAARRADEWHRKHPNLNRPNVPPREPPAEPDVAAPGEPDVPPGEPPGEPS
jgi:PhnB protein